LSWAVPARGLHCHLLAGLSAPAKRIRGLVGGLALVTLALP
jgi:hypothetical protein